MKKILFVILALCFAGSLALAQETAKPAEQKDEMATEEVSDVVVVSDEAKGTTEVAAVTEEVQEETPAENEAAKDTTEEAAK